MSTRRDISQFAKHIVNIALTSVLQTAPATRSVRGSQGGIARARKMTAAQRIDAARLAANARWKKSV